MPITYKEELFGPLVRALTSLVKIERIYLLGVTSKNLVVDNIYNKPGTVIATGVKEYQLLIITADSEKSGSDDLNDRIEAIARKVTPCVNIIIPLKLFNQWMNKGHMLSHRLYKAGHLLFDSGATVVSSLGNYDISSICKKVEKECEIWVTRATEMLYGVETFRKRQQFSLGTFLLHQVAELAFMAAGRLVTGYRMGTHNLDRLMRFCTAFCGIELNVFPRNNEYESKLFKLLQQAYIHGRYKNDYLVSEKDFLSLTDRVQLLLSATRDLFTKQTYSIALNLY